MANNGFLDVLNEALEKNFNYDYEINWDKKNHAVELSFILEAQNASGIETIDNEGQVTTEDIVFEEYVIFYNSEKSQYDKADYLVGIPYEAKKGFSREFLSYFVAFLNETADQGLDDLIDFLQDETQIDYEMKWDSAAFAAGAKELTETKFYAYPRY